MSAGGDVLLRPLRVEDEVAARQAHAEVLADDFPFLPGWRPEDPWPHVVRRYAELSRGVGVPEGHVPSTYLVADVAAELVGRVSIRHELNDRLLHQGGHIGYAVRPAFRHRGYATGILRQALVVARCAGVGRVRISATRATWRRRR